jgi:predicted phage terminase large subunit-like protein
MSLAVPALDRADRRHIKTSAYWAHSPTAKQLAFLWCWWIREVLYGGAARGGKSDALLMSALQYVEYPEYRAIIFRRTFPRLNMDGGLIPRSKEWLGGKGPVFDEVDHRWTVPSGATLTFGHMQNEDDKLAYQGGEWHFVGFDEVTEFSESQYTYMFSRQSQIVGSAIPLRMRATANPIGPGKPWVKKRWGISDDGVENPAPGRRVFIPAALDDNPHVDQETYDEGLKELGTILYLQLRHGRWDIEPEGSKFQKNWFGIVEPEEVPASVKRVRNWDLAATEEAKKVPGKDRPSDPDFTVGLRLARTPQGVYYVEDVVRGRWSDAGVETVVESTASQDGRSLPIRIEQEPGASGKLLISYYRRNVLDGYNFAGVPSSGDKEVRAAPVASRAEAGDVYVVRGPWNDDFLDEVGSFPQGLHDDQVDALSGAFAFLSGRPSSGGAIGKPVSMRRSSPWRPT